jgi:glycosyltransferase involved in cell wall biosynthesis
LKILQVIPYFFISWAKGQPAVVAYPLSKKLAELGHSVNIYTTDAFAGIKKPEVDQVTEEKISSKEGIRVHEFRSLRILATVFHINFFVSPTMFLAIRKNLRTFDIIHMHEYRTFQNIIVSYYAKKKGIPYVIQAHGSLPLLIGNQKQKRLFDTLWGVRMLKGATKVIASTSTEVKQYLSMGVNREKIAVIPNAINVLDFDDLPKKGVFRIKYGINENEHIILFLARIHKIKGLDLLAKAFAQLSREVNNIKLVIAGPDYGYLGEFKRTIEALKVQDKVLFTGSLYARAKLEAFVDADVYVLPSIYETFPVTVLEACACGTAVIVTDRCGIADVIDGRAGYAVPFDKEQLKEAFIKMLSNEQRRKEFGEYGRKMVYSQFTWSKVAIQVENLYLSCLLHNKSATC